MLPRCAFLGERRDPLSGDAFAEEHRVAALQVMEGLARKLAVRLRYANAELRHLEES